MQSPMKKIISSVKEAWCRAAHWRRFAAAKRRAERKKCRGMHNVQGPATFSSASPLRPNRSPMCSEIPPSFTLHTRFINAGLIFLIFGTLFFEVHLLTLAQEVDSGTADSGSPADSPADSSTADAPVTEDTPLAGDVSSKCVQQLTKFAAEKQVEFGDFINTHFRSAKPTSELIPTAIERYRQYRNEIRGEIARILDAEKKDGKDPQVVLSETSACESVVKENFAVMKDMLRQHITENAYAKKTTRLMDKLKGINEKLGKLNGTISQTYGYFGAFSQKLPCYAKQCIKN